MGINRVNSEGDRKCYSLFTRLIASGALKGWCAVRTLRKWWAGELYRSHYPFL